MPQEVKLAPWPDAPSVLSMKSIDELPRQNPLNPQLVNGKEAVVADWPASFYGIYEVRGDQYICTSTLIAPRALLTAAHCIADNGSVVITRNNVTYRGTCERPKNGYPGVISLDIAMCLMDADVPTNYERVSFDSKLVARDRRLLLAGFGCTRVGGQSDYKLRTGPAFIEYTLGTLKDYTHWIATYAGKVRADAFICEGDSGGAVYVEQFDAGQRLITAVNSHRDGAGDGISYLTALSSPAVAQFIRDWAQRKAQRLCGEYKDAKNCR